MKKLTWRENPHSRQATKQDLLDIAEALGAPTKALGNVPALRASIRWWLEKSRAARRQPSLFEPEVKAAGNCLGCTRPLPNDGRLFFCDACAERAAVEEKARTLTAQAKCCAEVGHAVDADNPGRCHWCQASLEQPDRVKPSSTETEDACSARTVRAEMKAARAPRKVRV
jgi:hypothetical protein